MRMGGVSVDVQNLHRTMALRRCTLEALVKTKELETLERCKVLVGTIGALATQSNVQRMKVMPGSRCFDLIGMDEISKSFHSDYSLWLACMSPSVPQLRRRAS